MHKFDSDNMSENWDIIICSCRLILSLNGEYLKEKILLLLIILLMEATELQYADEYTLHLLLGEGGQASVYLGSKDHQLYALKVYFPGQSKIDAFHIETDLLKKFNYKHLINMVDCRKQAKIKLTNKAQEIRPLIVLELAEGGELFQFLSKLGRFPPEVCRTYIKQLLSAIKYLNDIEFTHRDLKPQNILFDSEFLLKVSDFGLSRDAKGDLGDGKLKSRVGTEGYKPPEVDQGNYTGIQTDIFATGVVLFIMYAGTPPFLSTKPHQRIYKLIRQNNFTRFWQLHEKGKPPGFFSIEFKRLLNSFFSFDPKRRPTFQSLSTDDWMNGDELMNDDLKKFMQAKADKLFESDPVKKEIAKIKLKLYQQKLMEDECNEKEDSGLGDERGEVEEEIEEDMQDDQLFVKNYRRLHILTESLPLYEKKKISYTQQDPSFVVAWIQNLISEQFKNKEVYLNDFVGEITPVKYKLKYDKLNAQINLSFSFLIDEQDETELALRGQLHRSEKGGIGVEWSKIEGHSYWLASIENKLNESLQTLA